MPWSNFLSDIRNANPDLTPEVALIFDHIEKDNPFVYWCPNTGKKYEPLIFDAPVRQNPFSGRLYRTSAEQSRKRKILVWVNDSFTKDWIEPASFMGQLSLSPTIDARVHMKCLQHLKQPIKKQQGKNELKDFGVFEVCITNRHATIRDADTYILLFSMLKSEAMVKKVFAAYKLHVRLAALVESDLREAGESAESVLKFLNDHGQQVEDWKYLIAPVDTILPGWQRTNVHRDGWGRDMLWLWKHDTRLQAYRQPVEPVHQPATPDSAWACAMMRAVKSKKNVPFTITVEGRAGNQQSDTQSCSRFLKPLPAEKRVFRKYLKPFNDKGRFKVLDIGCGVGRHLKFVRDNFCNARLWGTESDPTLRKYCHENFGAKIWHSHEQMMLWPDQQVQAGALDVVLLLGNGIGLYGQPEQLRKGLIDMFRMLCPGGVLIGECGRLPDTPSNGYTEKLVTITIPFEEGKPTEFPWLFCGWAWLKPILQTAGFEIIYEKDIGGEEPGGFLFVAEKPS
jgi:SAM-dependent methyltransferase